MWFKKEVLYTRFISSLLWMLLLQEIFISCILFSLKFEFWKPFSSIGRWLLSAIHWKILLYHAVFILTTVSFGALNLLFYAVEKSISSTRFEKICKSVSPYNLQHIFITTILGGIIAFCCTGLFQNTDDPSITFLESCVTLEDDFYYYFVIGYGCYTGIMFSLKYFICSLYIIKFTLENESKWNCIKRQIFDLLRDSFTCVLKATHWYYLLLIIISPLLNSSASGSEEFSINMLYKLINPRLLIVSIVTGTVIFFNFSLYLCIFNIFAAEPYAFPIEAVAKENKNNNLCKALMSSECDILKYLAVLDLRLLAQNDLKRRQQIFSISHPGGHPYHWKSISDICITSLQKFLYQLLEYSMTTSSGEAKKRTLKDSHATVENITMRVVERKLPPFTQTVFAYFREKHAIAYFFDELPNARLMKLFASSQPSIWMIEALGYLVSASYNEDKFGVVQSCLQQIICLLLDIKMAEEKMPAGLVGIRTYVRDPQGRYEHIHQRLSLRSSVNNALCRIAATFKNDINGIYLPQEHEKYFQRYLKQTNA